MKRSISKEIVKYSVLVLFVTLFVVVNVQTQGVQDNPSRGSKVGNSYSVGDIETINLTNGNLMINFPLGSLPAGRGSAAGGLSLVYNSKLYDIQTHRILDQNPPPAQIGPLYFNKSVVVPSTTGGWRFASGYNLETENRMDSYGENVPSCTNEGTSQPFYYVNTHRHKLFVVSPDGGKHEMIPHGYDDYLDDGFYEPRVDGKTYLCGSGYVNIGTGLTYYSIDGTYMRLEVASGGGSWTLYFADGGKATSDGKIYDRNGNYVETSGYYSAPNVWNATGATDQFGRSVGRSTDTNGDTLITSKGVGGEDIVWTVKWKQMWVSKTYQSCPDTPGNPSNCETGHFRSDLDVSSYVVDKIIQPDELGGGEYIFEYNGASSNPTGLTDGWGEISKITLPSGAFVTYDYSMDGLDGPEDFEETKKILRNHVVEKTLEYDLEYDGSTTDAPPEVWTYGIEPTSGGITGPSGAGTAEAFESTETVLPSCPLPPCEPNPLPWNSGLTYLTTNPDGSKVEKIWAQNIPVGSDHMGGWAAFNPYVKTEFTSIGSGGTYTLTAIKDFTYDKNGNVTEVKEYDWMPYGTSFPSGAASYLKRVTKTELYNPTPAASSTTYNDPDSYIYTSSERLLRLPKSVTVEDASSVTKSRSEITYDYTNYDSSNTKAGNPTLTRAWDSTKGSVTNPLTDGNSVKTQATYNSYGMPVTTKDANNVETQITYGSITKPGGTVSDLYPTHTIAAYGTGLARTSTATYDFFTGVTTSATDEDNDVTNATVYDDLGRPTIVKNAYGTALETWTQTTYDDVNRRVIVKSDLETKEDAKKVATQFFDQLGRVRLSKTLEDSSTQSATNETDGIKVQTRYKYHSGTPSSSNGTYTLTSNPFRSATTSAASGEPTMGWSVSYENALGNLKTTESFAGSGLPSLWGSNTTSTGKSETTEDLNTTTTIDEAGKKRRTVTDALGRLIRVDEPNSDGNLGSVSSPNQDTNYTNDTLGNLTQIVQGGQTRTFTYSSLSRLLSSTNPESGMFTYTYDNSGNLLVKTDARGITTTHTYDALNRVTAKNYSGSTPDVTYTYDDSQVPFSKGKLTKVDNGVSVTEYIEFDAQGRINESKQITDAETYTSSYVYNLAGGLIEQTYPSGRVVKNVLDNNGDLSIVQSKKNDTVGFWNYAKHFSYAASGFVGSMQLGNGRWESTQFNSRLQPTQIALGTVQNGTNHLKLEYGYGTAANNGNVLSHTITVPAVGQSSGFTAVQSYTYDSLNRLKSAEEVISSQTSWKQTFTFDRYGNRNFDEANTVFTGFQKLCNGNTELCPELRKVLNPSVNPSDNRLSSSDDYVFDNAGNTTEDAQGRTFVYDAENKQIEVKGSQDQTIGQYWYDGDGKRVKKYVPSTSEVTIFVYDIEGRMVAEYSTTLSQLQSVVYVTTDQLGSPRITTNENGAIVSRRDLHPFGEEISSTLRIESLGYKLEGMRRKFTTYERDSEVDLDFAQARYFSPKLGRFLSVDPENAGATLGDPQSWNAYSYARNNPILFTDSDGLEVKYCDTSGACVNLTDREANNTLFNKKFQASLGYTVKNGKVRDGDGNLIGTYVNDSPAFQLAQSVDENFRRKAPVQAGAMAIGVVVGVCKGACVAIYAGAKALLKKSPTAISRLPRPATPNGMSLSKFGGDVMKWGTRNADARARISSLTKSELEASGVTRAMAKAWRDFYINEAKRMPSNPSAAGRADLMQRAVDLLSK